MAGFYVSIARLAVLLFFIICLTSLLPVEACITASTKYVAANAATISFGWTCSTTYTISKVTLDTAGNNPICYNARFAGSYIKCDLLYSSPIGAPGPIEATVKYTFGGYSVTTSATQIGVVYPSLVTPPDLPRLVANKQTNFLFLGAALGGNIFNVITVHLRVTGTSTSIECQTTSQSTNGTWVVVSLPENTYFPAYGTLYGKVTVRTGYGPYTYYTGTNEVSVGTVYPYLQYSYVSHPATKTSITVYGKGFSTNYALSNWESTGPQTITSAVAGPNHVNLTFSGPATFGHIKYANLMFGSTYWTCITSTGAKCALGTSIGYMAPVIKPGSSQVPAIGGSGFYVYGYGLLGSLATSLAGFYSCEINSQAATYFYCSLAGKTSATCGAMPMYSISSNTIFGQGALLGYIYPVITATTTTVAAAPSVPIRISAQGISNAAPSLTVDLTLSGASPTCTNVRQISATEIECDATGLDVGSETQTRTLSAALSCGGSTYSPFVQVATVTAGIQIDENLLSRTHPTSNMVTFNGLNFGTATTLQVNVTSPAGLTCTVKAVTYNSVTCEFQTTPLPVNTAIFVSVSRTNIVGSLAGPVQISYVEDFAAGTVTATPESLVSVQTRKFFVKGTGFGYSCSDLVVQVVPVTVVPVNCTDSFIELSKTSGVLDSGQIVTVAVRRGGLLFPGPVAIATAVGVPLNVPTPTNLYLANSLRLAISASGVGSLAETAVSVYTLEENKVCHPTDISTTSTGASIVYCTIDTPWSVADARLYGYVSRLDGFGSDVQIGHIVTDPAILTNELRVANSARSITFMAINLGLSLFDLRIELEPIGNCSLSDLTIISQTGQYEQNLVTCWLPDFSTYLGNVSAVVHRLGGRTNSLYAFEAVSAPEVKHSEAQIRASKDYQQIQLSGSGFAPGATDVDFILETSSQNRSIQCEEISATETNITCSSKLSFAGKLYAIVTANYGASAATLVHQVFLPPYVSYRYKTANDASSVKIVGGGFGSIDAPSVNLTLWTGPSGASFEYIELSDFPEYTLPCTVTAFSEEYILCSIPPLATVVPQLTSGVIYGSVYALGRSLGPTVFADIVSPPSVNPAELLYSPTTTSFIISGQNFATDRLEVKVELGYIIETSGYSTVPCIVSLSSGGTVLECTADISTFPQGRIVAYVSTHGSNTAYTIIGNVVPASKAAPVTPRPVSSSIQKVVVAGEGLPMGDLAPLHATIQVWIRDPAQNQTVPSDGQIRTCGTISTESPEGTLTCVLGDDLSATLSNSSEFELWIYPIVYRGPMVRISSKRAEEKVGWTKLGSIVPAPVIDYVDQIPTITTIATSFTIQGRNFAPGVTQVEFDPIASVTPMCEVTEVTETQVTCKLSQLSVGTLTARVVANYGPSNTQSVAAIAPDESLRLGLGVGIPVGLIVICGVIFLIVILVKVVSRRRLRSMFTSKATKFRDAMSSSELAEINAMEQKAKEALAQWTVPYSDIKFGKEVGKGSFGKVFVGKWNGKKVAIKEAQLEDPRAREEFFKEAFLMLGMTPHVRILLLKTAKAKPGLKYFGVPSLQPNVVQVLGISIVTETHTCYILMDIMYGSLDKLVYNPENRAKLDSDALTKFARGIAAGMAHLSTEGIIHRDLAVRNVLISKDGAPKVADFGMSRRVESGGSGQTNAVVGPLRWMSREALLQTYSEKTDVWAYGCTLLEMITGQEPWHGVDQLEAALAVRDQGASPSIPDRTPKRLAKVLTRCFVIDTDQRATFKEIVQMLDDA